MFIVSWNAQSICRNSRIIWNTALFAFAWTIWCCRNETIFKNASSNVVQIFEIVVLRLMHWLKAKWPSSNFQFHDLLFNPSCVSLEIPRINRREASIWKAPRLGELKFNVDASTSGSFGKAGVGGIPRNYQGVSLALFSKPIGVSDPTGAEISAILEACNLSSMIQQCKHECLAIESDCEQVLRWIADTKNCPAVFLDRVLKCAHFGLKYKWKFRFVYRESNITAHRLAVKGRCRSDDFVWCMK
ncbi:hypothetical protein HRI_003192500 [Hibiscus trionum]|uniref:RNase H type-1 domain-containing protein n=1 Tax=Hibiscus trionum TaxID=183268 RepID=A0A9W7IEZ9_HIBTR|nr:hypothetical protein HRI_003192500 [Hibiscus trionum]